MTKTGSKIYRIVSVLIVIAIAVTIFVLSAQNSEASNETSGAVIGFFARIFGNEIPQEVIRTVAHFCEYAGFGFFMCNAFFAFKDSFMPILSALTSFGYAVTDEIHQIFVPGRAFQISDLAVDLGGIILGTVVFVLFVSIVNKIKLNKRKTVN